METIKFNNKIFDKETLLFVMNVSDYDYDLEYEKWYYMLYINEKITESELKEIKREIQDQQLRKDIAKKNKKLREYIVSTALSIPKNLDTKNNWDEKTDE